MRHDHQPLLLLGSSTIADATSRINNGWAEVIIAGGCESMSHIPMGGGVLRPNFDWPADLPWVYISMGLTAENVAERYKVSREDMDAFGMESNRRAYEAIKAGKFKGRSSRSRPTATRSRKTGAGP